MTNKIYSFPQNFIIKKDFFHIDNIILASFTVIKEKIQTVDILAKAKYIRRSYTHKVILHNFYRSLIRKLQFCTHYHKLQW